MRKWIVFVMLILGVASANAQWKVAPEAGMNVTMYKNEGAKIGYKAGAAVSYTFESGWFSLQSGLYYVQRGKAAYSYSEIYGTRLGEDGKRYPAGIDVYPPNGKYSGGWGMYSQGNGYGFGSSNGYYGNYLNNGYGQGDFSNFDVEGIRTFGSKEHRGYLQLPVLARFNWNVAKDVRLHLAVGPYVALGIAGKYTQENSDWGLRASGKPGDEGYGMNYSGLENSWNPFNNDQYFEVPRFDWGATVEAGIEVKRFSFKVGYDMGFGKNYHGDDSEPKYHTVSFTVGYTF